MSLARHLLREFRPLFQMLDQPLARAPASLFYPASRSFFDEPSLLESPNHNRLSVDVTEHFDSYVVETDLPGVKKENIQVRIGDGGRSITINGKIEPKTPQTTLASESSSGVGDESTAVVNAGASTAEANQLTTERSFGGTTTANFTRTVYLPRVVDTSKVNAKLKDGVLTVTVQKAADSEGSVAVPVD